MKQILFACFLLLGVNYPGNSQSTISTYNGKKWEQLEGSGNLIRWNTTLNAFNTIEVNNMNVKIRVQTGAAEFAMNVSIDDNLKDFLKWALSENTLKLSFDMSGGKYPRWLSGNNTVVTIMVPSIEKLVNKGNSNLEISLQNQSSFSLVSNGNPDIELTGMIKELSLESVGNADIKAGNLAAEKILLSTNGNADIEVKTRLLVEKEIKGNNDIVNLYYDSNKVKEEDDDNDYRSESERGLVSFRVKNNRALPAKVTVVSYRPDRAGNGTTTFTLLGLGSKKFSFPAGTKIYLASREQVNTVMSGAKISDQEPFLVVKNEDKGKTFSIK